MKALGVFTIDIDGAGIAIMICIFYSITSIIVYVISEESRVCNRQGQDCIV